MKLYLAQTPDSVIGPLEETRVFSLFNSGKLPVGCLVSAGGAEPWITVEEHAKRRLTSLGVIAAGALFGVWLA